MACLACKIEAVLENVQPAAGRLESSQYLWPSLRDSTGGTLSGEDADDIHCCELYLSLYHMRCEVRCTSRSEVNSGTLRDVVSGEGSRANLDKLLCSQWHYNSSFVALYLLQRLARMQLAAHNPLIYFVDPIKLSSLLVHGTLTLSSSPASSFTLPSIAITFFSNSSIPSSTSCILECSAFSS